MIDLKLIFHDGCPNVHQARNNLLTAGYRFDEISQDQLPEGHPFRNYSSPTILKGDRPVFGTVTGPGNPGCTLASIPTAEALKRMIGSLKE